MKDYQPTGSGGQRTDNTLLYVVLSMMFAVALLTFAFLNNLVQFVFKSPIVVTGQVLGSDGSPLNQVNVSVHSSRFSLFGDDFSAGADFDRSVSDRFKMACKFCSHLDLRFHKQGYYGRRLSVSRGRGDGPAKINNRDYRPGVEDPFRTTLVMQKIGATPDLLLGAAVIRTGDEGIETVLTFDKTERPHEVNSDDIDLAGDTPFFFISAAVRSNGDLQIKNTGQKFRPRSSPGQLVPLWHPVDIALVASPPGGGFNPPAITLYQDEYLTPIDKRRRMVTAPSDGYTNRLEIDP